MEEKEEWRDIPGYCGIYQINRCGAVRSYAMGREIPALLKLTKKGDYHLTKNRECKRVGMSRIMKEVWPECWPIVKQTPEKKANEYEQCNQCIYYKPIDCSMKACHHLLITGKRWHRGENGKCLSRETKAYRIKKEGMKFGANRIFPTAAEFAGAQAANGKYASGVPTDWPDTRCIAQI